MNIFVLDEDPVLAAKYHCDKHVVKMILESAQMMCTVAILQGAPEEEIPYRPTHPNHPCVRWLREDASHRWWLKELLIELAREYSKRYQKKAHKSFEVVINNHILWDMFFDLEPEYPEHFANCTPYKDLPVVEAYRKYYREDKASIVTWKTKVPEWYYV